MKGRKRYRKVSNKGRTRSVSNKRVGDGRKINEV